MCGFAHVILSLSFCHDILSCAVPHGGCAVGHGGCAGGVRIRTGGEPDRTVLDRTVGGVRFGSGGCAETRVSKFVSK